jgi:deoxyhypusine synthase
MTSYNCGNTKLQELSLLDLKKCDTVNDIVTGMGKCSFGARCAGEVTDTLHHIIDRDAERVIVYDGSRDSTLGKYVQDFSKKFGFKLMTATGYSNVTKKRPQNLFVIGRFSERHEAKIHEGGEFNTIFINKEELSAPGQTRDGYFPNVLFVDPTYGVPLISTALDERLNGKKTSVSEFVTQLGTFDYGLANEVSGGAKNFSRIANDPKYTIFMTMSGAMTIAQMSYVLCDMIDNSLVNSLTTTGAAMAHGLVESMGYKHYKHDPKIPDSVLTRRKLNRVTDTLEPEENFDHIDEIVHSVLSGFSGSSSITPSTFHARIGKYLHDNFPGERGILKSAFEKNIPVFVPAFFDSEIGNDITTYNIIKSSRHQRKLRFDLEAENHKLVDMVQRAERTGLFTVGGGVPRNWTQNVAPLIEIINGRTSKGLAERKFSSGIRIDPASMALGHLSGCTYGEGMTWRKMDPKGLFIEIHGDATTIWPIVVKYALERKAA